MTGPRVQLADAIRADWPDLAVYDFGYQPEELREPAVVVFRDTVDQTSAGGQLDHKFTIQIFSPQGYPTLASENTLDDLLDNVLLSLRRLDVVAFQKATRKVFLDLFQGWEVEAVWTSQDYYKTTVTNER